MTKKVTIKVVDGIQCPSCGSEEMHPNGNRVLIRAFRIQDLDGYWWSQCLVCSELYDEDLVPAPINHNSDKGGFCEHSTECVTL